MPIQRIGHKGTTLGCPPAAGSGTGAIVYLADASMFMDGENAALDRDALNWWLHQVGVPDQKLATLGPDFLIISPPKTGSTWLAANLGCHPQLFVPPGKELKYFSSFCKALDLNWYLDHFHAEAGRRKGEASPSYALLPVERIRLVRRLWPRVKLLFLMREPIARAWSHAKHCYRYKEANFVGRTEEFEAVTDDQWRANFAHEWPLASGDYLGQLRRWLSVFPHEQIRVGFYEWIASRPEALLRDIFAFLGVDTAVDLASFPVANRLLPGISGELSPPLEEVLHRLLGARAEELASFVQAHFGLETPPEWRKTLIPPGGEEPAAGRAMVFDRDCDDAYLARILEHEEHFPSARCSVLEGYRGYNIFFRGGRLYALEQGVGPARSEEIDEDQLGQHQHAGRCFTAFSLAEVKERVNRHVFERREVDRDTLASLQADLRRAREQMARLEAGLAEAAGAVGKIEADLARRPWYRGVARALRRGWHRLRTA